jgi:thiamine-phosphate pyrophosphorylase
MTDDERLPDPLPAVRALPRGSAVIVRSRTPNRRLELATTILGVARSRSLVVLIADDAKLARQCDADGIHLPEARARESGHWRARNPRWLITVAAHSLEAVVRASRADAILLSSVFATESHPARIPLSPARARAIAQMSILPVYALGGIDDRNASLIRGRNYAGIAAISALRV